MSYIKLPERTSDDSNSAADVNQLQENLDEVVGGDSPVESLNSQKSRLDGHDTDIDTINTYVDTHLMYLKVLSADVVNNNATLNTLADLSDLSFPVVSGKSYYFKAIIGYTSAATTTGSRWTINGPAMTFCSYKSVYTLTATTLTTNYNVAIQTPAACNASSLTAGNIAEVEGIITPSEDGTVTIQFASETANVAITAKKGSVLFYKEVA